MKTKFTLLVIMIIAFFSAKSQVGQLPNNFFQVWTDPHTPDGWITLDSLFPGVIVGTSVKDSSDHINGLPFSLELNAVANGFAPGGVAVGLIRVGGGMPEGAAAPLFYGLPFQYRPDTITFFYQYKSMTADTASFQVKFSKNDTAIFENAFPLDTTLVGDWGVFSLFLTGHYVNSENPDTLQLEFTTSAAPANGAGTLGDTMHVQAVLLGYVTLPSGLQQIADKMNFALYPNPSTDVINISSAENAEGFRVFISDMSGKLVYGSSLNGSKTSISTESLASGMYIYRIADATGNILKQDKFMVTR